MFVNIYNKIKKKNVCISLCIITSYKQATIMNVSSNEEFFSLTKNKNKEKLKQNGLNITMDIASDWEDIFHELPYISSVFKLAKAGLMIRDFQFIKKVGLFLNSSNGYDDDEFDEFYNGLKEKEVIKLSDFLINTILNIDENAKAEIIGYIYKYRVKKQIDNDMMIRLCANIMAGHTIILALTCLIFITATMGVAVNFGMTIVSVLFCAFMNCLELLVACLQAYIFTLLSANYIGLAKVRE